MTNLYEALTSILDMLDEVERRVDDTQKAYDADEYVKSGVREAKQRVFDAIRKLEA